MSSVGDGNRRQQVNYKTCMNIGDTPLCNGSNPTGTLDVVERLIAGPGTDIKTTRMVDGVG